MRETTVRSQMVRVLPLAIAVVLLGLLTYLQGTWSGRWSSISKKEARQLVELLERVPNSIGDWQGTDVTASKKELVAAGAVGHLTRTYTNRASGQHVMLFLVVGHARDIARHTPDVCYPAAGFTTLQDKTQCQLGKANSKFFTATFQKQAPDDDQQVRVYWAWGNNGNWKAPQWPENAFANENALFKLYLICDTKEESETNGEEAACAQFAESLLPIVTAALLAEEAAPDSPAEN